MTLSTNDANKTGVYVPPGTAEWSSVPTDTSVTVPIPTATTTATAPTGTVTPLLPTVPAITGTDNNPTTTAVGSLIPNGGYGTVFGLTPKSIFNNLGATAGTAAGTLWTIPTATADADDGGLEDVGVNIINTITPRFLRSNSTPFISFDNYKPLGLENIDYSKIKGLTPPKGDLGIDFNSMYAGKGHTLGNGSVSKIIKDNTRPFGKYINQTKNMWNGLTSLQKANVIYNTVGSLMNLYNQRQANKMTKQALNFSREYYKKDYEMRKKQYNMSLEDRQAYRQAYYNANGGAKPLSVNEYLRKYGA